MQRNNEHPVAVDCGSCIRVRFHAEAILIAIALFYAGDNVNMVCRLVVFPLALEEAIFVSADFKLRQYREQFLPPFTLKLI